MKTIERPQLIINSTLFILLAIIFLMLTTTGCVRERVEGNYDQATDTRSTGLFSEVESNSDIHVNIVPDLVSRVIVEAESNIIPLVYTNNDGTTLRIGFRNGYNIREHYMVKVTVYTPELTSISLSGSGNIESGLFNVPQAELMVSGSGNIYSQFNAAQLNASVTGSGTLSVKGAAGNSHLNVSGSGRIDALELVQTICYAGVSGSGSIKTHVLERLEATVSGSGSIYYLGDPVLSTHITGSGFVRKY